MNIRSPNWFYTSSRFLSFAFWKDLGAGVLIWPAVWVQPLLEPSLDVRLHRWTVGWWRWRFQCDFGTWLPLAVDGPIDWERLGVDSYLAWTKKTFGRNWGRADVERLFRRDPAWRRLAVLGTAQNHYVKVTLARAMMSAVDAPLTPGLAGPGGSVEGDRTTTPSQKAWTEGTVSATSTQSLMQDLEQLGANLRRNDDTTET